MILKNEIVLFTDGDINLEVELSPELETVWLTQKQMEALFDVKHATVSEHISNILASGELDETSVGFSDKSSGERTRIYNLGFGITKGPGPMLAAINQRFPSCISLIHTL